MSEPTTADAVAAWIEKAQSGRDRFEQVRTASHEHRKSHGPGCSVYPTSSGPLLGVLAGSVGRGRILEVGTGLGYSALWLAYGSGGHVDTVEHDEGHAVLAEEQVRREGYADRIRVLRGRAAIVLEELEGPYDLVFSDCDPEEMPVALDHFLRLLRPRALLVSANLFLAQFVPDLVDLEQMADYRQRILDDERLLTAFVPGGMALSVRQEPR